jgi:hypothetical protein
MFLAHIALSGSLIVSSLWHWSGVLQMIVEKDTVMIKAAHVGQLLFHKKEKV